LNLDYPNSDNPEPRYVKDYEFDVKILLFLPLSAFIFPYPCKKAFEAKSKPFI